MTAAEDSTPGGRSAHAPTGVAPSTAAWATLKRVVSETGEDDLVDRAAALTFYFLLAAFPTVIALVSVVGLVVDPQVAIDALTELVDTVAPGNTEVIAWVIDDLAGSATTASLGLVLGLGSAVFAASRYVGAFARAANVVLETPEGRPFYVLKPVQLLITLVGFLAAVAVGLVVVAAGPVLDALAQVWGLGPVVTTIAQVVRWPLLLVVATVLVALLYHLTPNVRRRRFRLISPGSLVALLAWVAVTAAFAFYLSTFAGSLYGALTGVVFTMLWLWITNLVLLVGLELDAELERNRQLSGGVPGADVEIQLEPRAEPRPPRTV